MFGRGIDIERINLAINYDLPADADSYLHRVGRAGRFGTKGLAISFVTTDQDKEVLQQIEKRSRSLFRTYPLHWTISVVHLLTLHPASSPRRVSMPPPTWRLKPCFFSGDISGHGFGCFVLWSVSLAAVLFLLKGQSGEEARDKMGKERESLCRERYQKPFLFRGGVRSSPRSCKTRWSHTGNDAVDLRAKPLSVCVCLYVYVCVRNHSGGVPWVCRVSKGRGHG